MLNNVKKLFSGKVNVFAIIISIVALLFALLFTPIFNIKNIQVTGNESIDSKTIIDASGIVTGKSIFKINPGSVIEYVSRVPYVESVKLKRKFPDTVIIEITEGKVVAYINFAGNYVAINEKGKILDVIERSEGTDKPVVYGIIINEFEIGKDISVSDDIRKDVLFNILEQIKACNLETDIMYIDVNDVDSITFTLRNKTSVRVGNIEGIRYKMAFLRSVLDSFTDEEGGVIDLRDTNNVFYDAG